MTRPPTGRFLSQQILRARKRFFRPVGLRSRASFFLTSRIAKAAAMIFGAVVITLWPLRAGRLSARRVAQRAGANAAFMHELIRAITRSGCTVRTFSRAMVDRNKTGTPKRTRTGAAAARRSSAVTASRHL